MPGHVIVMTQRFPLVGGGGGRVCHVHWCLQIKALKTPQTWTESLSLSNSILSKTDMLPASWMGSSSDFLKKFNQTNVISCSERQKLPLLFTELHGVVSKAQHTARWLTATSSWLWTGASQVAASVGVSVEESTRLVEGSHIFVWKERLAVVCLLSACPQCNLGDS